tara:strand:- start:646 stop:1665 length:1020 start_codon:yes stop_codon:yes gene_type:complete
MKINNFDTNKKTLIIAEVGNNHEGSYSLAEDLVGLASDSGADAIKFQTFKTKFFVDKSDMNRFNMLKSFELTYNDFEKLKKVASSENLIFISTPLDLMSAQFLSKIVDAIKISSGDNTFYPLIEEVARMGKPTILSTGLSDLKQITKAKKLIDETCIKNKIKSQLAILHCVSAYPVDFNQANLLAIKTLINEFDCDIGYSDHTIGIHAATSAVALGANIIEKHFTIDKQFSDFRDHQLSADPTDLKKLVKEVREIEAMLGSGIKKIQDIEKDALRLMRRSVVAKNRLAKGHIIQIDDISWTRPSGGINPGDESMIIGKKLKNNIDAGSKILRENLQENS